MVALARPLFGGVDVQMRPTALRGSCAVVVILFFRYRLANRCPYQLTTAPLGCVGDV